MASPLKVGGTIWKRHKADILRHLSESVDDLIELETDIDKAVLTMKLAQIQAKFTYLAAMAEDSTNGRGGDK